MLPLFLLSRQGMGQNDEGCSGNAKQRACQQICHTEFRCKADSFPIEMQEKQCRQSGNTPKQTRPDRFLTLCVEND